LNLGDTIEVVKQRRKSKKWKKYYGFDLIGKRGRVIELEPTNIRNKPCQRVKVKFPCIWINSENGKKPVYGFEWSFYGDEVKRIDEEIKFRPQKTALRGKALERRKKVVQEMRQKGESIENLAKRFNVHRATIWRWLTE